MNPSTQTQQTKLTFYERYIFPALSRNLTYFLLCIVIWLLDLASSPYVQFPILFVIPVALSAWFYSQRLAYCLSLLLPLGRFYIAHFNESNQPFVYNAANGLVRIAVLLFIAYLTIRLAIQTRKLEKKVETLVTMCAWSRTIEYEGEWISFEAYLLRRFKINTSHGISPTELQRLAEKASISNAKSDKDESLI